MQNKATRQKAMTKLINDRQIETQDELAAMLEKIGYSVTQATLSRDLKDMGVSKVRNETGKLVYSAGPVAAVGAGWPALERMAESLVNEATAAGNLVVVKTLPGYASGVAAAVDSVKNVGVVGSVAGDDTILVVMSDGKAGRRFADRLLKGS
jgi:transcriptional regulator of arginine metabolism